MLLYRGTEIEINALPAMMAFIHHCPSTVISTLAASETIVVVREYNDIYIYNREHRLVFLLLLFLFYSPPLPWVPS